MLRLITVVLTLAITMSACSPSRAQEANPNLKAEYVEFVRTKAPATSGVIALTDEQLLKNGQGTCLALQNNGETTPALISSSYDRTWPGAGPYMVGAALSYLCPEFGPRVDD